MKGEMLTIKSSIMCPHGGHAVLRTSNEKFWRHKSLVLLESDVHLIDGCLFTNGPKYSPCIRIEWKAGQDDVRVDGTPVLCEQSMGICYNAEGTPQGIGVIVNP